MPANAGAVRAAVESLVARNIPASYIRSRTLARVERGRGRFIELLRQALPDGIGHRQWVEKDPDDFFADFYLWYPPAELRCDILSVA